MYASMASIDVITWCLIAASMPRYQLRQLWGGGGYRQDHQQLVELHAQLIQAAITVYRSE